MRDTLVAGGLSFTPNASEELLLLDHCWKSLRRRDWIVRECSWLVWSLSGAI